MSDGLNLGPGVTRNPDGSFNYNGAPVPGGHVDPSMTYSPVNTRVPTVGIPGVGTPGASPGGPSMPSYTSVGGGGSGLPGDSGSSAYNSDAWGKIKGAGGDVWDFIKGHPELLPVVLSIIQNARQSSKAGSQQNEALDLARQQYADRAPFRAQLGTALSTPAQAAPDFSAQFANPSNPYSKIKAPALMKTDVLGQALSQPLPPANPNDISQSRRG